MPRDCGFCAEGIHGSCCLYDKPPCNSVLLQGGSFSVIISALYFVLAAPANIGSTYSAISVFSAAPRNAALPKPRTRAVMPGNRISRIAVPAPLPKILAIFICCFTAMTISVIPAAAAIRDSRSCSLLPRAEVRMCRTRYRKKNSGLFLKI